MDDRERIMRDFGILPDPSAAPAGRVRSVLTPFNVVTQWLMSGCMLIGCGGTFSVMAIAFTVMGFMSTGKDRLFIASFPLFGGVAAVFAWITYVVMKRSPAWVELDGDVIRIKNLYTGQITERRVEEIEEIGTEVVLVKNAAVMLTEHFQGRVRNFAIRFPGTKDAIRVYRPEMNNVEELIQAIAAQMARKAPIAPEIINFEGRPMVRRITWASRLEG